MKYWAAYCKAADDTVETLISSSGSTAVILNYQAQKRRSSAVGNLIAKHDDKPFTTDANRTKA